MALVPSYGIIYIYMYEVWYVGTAVPVPGIRLYEYVR